MLDRAARLAAGRAVVRVAGFRPRRVAALVKESLHAPARARFEASVRQKVEALGSELVGPVYVADELGPVTAALRDLLAARPAVDVILTAGGASTDPDDPFYRALAAVGGRLVRRGVPAHPGSMLWLGRAGTDDHPGAAHLRRLLAGDGRRPPPALAAQRRPRHAGHRGAAGPRRDPDPRHALPHAGLRARASTRPRGSGPVRPDERGE